MNIKKKLTTFVLTFAMVLSLIPTLRVQAATADFKIISDSEVTAKQAKKWAKSKGATETFIDIADLYFKYSSDCGDVNPAIAYVQAAKETGFGRFGGVIDESYHNPCGMKKATGGGDYDKDAHQKFDNWDEGVQAHMDHLALYAGAKGYPKENTYDPKHFVTLKGKATTINDLGTRWAPSSTYGQEITELYKNLMDSAGVDYPKDTKDDKDDNEELSNAVPNPGKTETKPSALSVSDVISENKPQNEEDKPSITSTIGWKNENGNWYYYKSDDTKAIGWIKPDSNWYYLKDDGKMATGWQMDNGKWYYLDSSGVITKGWKHLNNVWYYFQGDGTMVTGLNRIDNKIYMLNSDGAMTTGWIQQNNYWYFFNSDGSMATGWITDGGSKYYLYDTGAMAKGWINLNGTWYNLKDSGAMVTGWVTSNGDSYYLDPSTGKLATNTKIDEFNIGSDGKKKASSSKIDENKDDNNPISNPINNNPSNGKKTIVVDPGHNYGGDGGAVATIDGVTYSETELNMQVASKLKTELENKGYNVIMTRNQNQKETLPLMQSLTNRVNIANNANADFFVSIHHNSIDNAPTANGVLTLYSNVAQDSTFGGKLDSNRVEKSKKLATLINNNIASKLDLNNRGGQNQNLFVCRNANMPAVLVETGFITNKEEAKRCADPASQQKVAEAIAEVIASNI